MCKSVRDVRGFGMLIAIELDVRRGAAERWQQHSAYLLDMLRDPAFPVLVGFCQYEPHVLKLTPPLTTTAEEVERAAHDREEPAPPVLSPAARVLSAYARSYLPPPNPRGPRMNLLRAISTNSTNATCAGTRSSASTSGICSA